MNFINKYKLHKYNKYLKNKLSKSRYIHSLKVAETALKMAERYNSDMYKAAFSGLMHDIAREHDFDDLIKLAEQDGFEIENYEKENPVLLHARAGAVLLEKIFGINDEEILASIRNHTLGSVNMDLLSKIIFSADYIVPRKSHYNKKLASLYKTNEIDFIVVKVLENMIAYDKSCNRKILKPVMELYRSYNNGVN